MEIVQALEERSGKPGPGRASDCAKDCGSRLRARRMSASRLCSIGWPGAKAAIVSPHAGTTRDVIEVHLDSRVFR